MVHAATLRVTALEGTYYGKEVHIECRPTTDHDGDDVNRIIITKDEAKVDSKALAVHDDNSGSYYSTYFIRSLTLRDEGIYKCYIFMRGPSLPLHSQNETLIVKPVFSIKETSQSNGALTLSCKFTPKGSIKYVHTFMVTEDGEKKAIYGGHNDHITVTPRTKGNKNYSCMVDMKVDNFRVSVFNERHSNNTMINIPELRSCGSKDKSVEKTYSLAPGCNRYPNCLHDHCWCVYDGYVYDRCRPCCASRYQLATDVSSVILQYYWVLIVGFIFGFFIVSYFCLRSKRKKKKRKKKKKTITKVKEVPSPYSETSSKDSTEDKSPE